MINIVKLIFIFLLFSCTASYSQTVISGQLSDESGKAIANVSITYKRVGSSSIIGFSKSSKDGQFMINLKVEMTDSVQLDFNHMSYAKKSIVVANKTGSYKLTLNYQVRQLDEVKVRDNPITQRKDTINYKLESFITTQDRVIADVIKKLPGIKSTWSII
jgi:lipopolysaccharide export LptBFGC system permease protein LptF